MGVVSTNIGIDFISKETSLRFDCNYLLTDTNISKTNYYRFSELFDIVDCRVDVLDIEEFYYVEIGDISKNEDVYPVKLSWDTRNELNENYFQKIEKGDIIKPKVGDILIAKVRPNLKKYILIDENTSFYYYTSAFIVLRPKQINKPLFYALKTLFYNNLIAIARQGKGYPTISDKDLKFLKFERKLIESLRENSTSIESEIELIEKEILTLKSQIVPEQDIINEIKEEPKHLEEVKENIKRATEVAEQLEQASKYDDVEEQKKLLTEFGNFNEEIQKEPVQDLLLYYNSEIEFSLGDDVLSADLTIPDLCNRAKAWYKGYEAAVDRLIADLHEKFIERL